MADEKVLKEQLESVNKQIMVMEWDKSRNQLNPGKLPMYNELKAEQEQLQKEIDALTGVCNDEVDLNSGSELKADDVL